MMFDGNVVIEFDCDSSILESSDESSFKVVSVLEEVKFWVKFSVIFVTVVSNLSRTSDGDDEDDEEEDDGKDNVEGKEEEEEEEDEIDDGK